MHSKNNKYTYGQFSIPQGEYNNVLRINKVSIFIIDVIYLTVKLIQINNLIIKNRYFKKKISHKLSYFSPSNGVF